MFLNSISPLIFLGWCPSELKESIIGLRSNILKTAAAEPRAAAKASR